LIIILPGTLKNGKEECCLDFFDGEQSLYTVNSTLAGIAIFGKE
jgi:hypothetical protein